MRNIVRYAALLACGFLVGSLLGPAAAQQLAPSDGQVALRSDGAIYLITNGQRRWVPTIAISDDDLNAIPEGDPVYAALMPADAVTPVPAANAPGGTPESTRERATRTPTPVVDATATPTATSTSGSSSSGDVSVSIDSIDSVKRGNSVTLTAHTNKNATCELRVRYADGSEDKPGKIDADSKGKCEWTFTVPSDAKNGTATATVKAKDGSRSGEASRDFDVRR